MPDGNSVGSGCFMEQPEQGFPAGAAGKLHPGAVAGGDVAEIFRKLTHRKGVELWEDGKWEGVSGEIPDSRVSPLLLHWVVNIWVSATFGRIPS